MSFQYVLVIVACAIATISDVRARRIPNWLTFGLALTSLALRAFEGPGATISALVACGLVLGCGASLFAMKLLGGGDVKLAAAVALALGWPQTTTFAIATLLAGGVLSVAISSLRGQLAQTVRNVSKLVRPAIYRGTAIELPVSTATVPYAIAITAGALITIAPSVWMS